MEWRIRRGQVNDAKALWPLCVGFGLVMRDELRTVTLEPANRERIDRVLSSEDQIVLVAEKGDQLIGYTLAQDYGVSLRRDWSIVRLHDLYVDPDFRREGVARALHTGVVEWCSKRPVRFMEWQASSGAIDFYTRIGYIPDTRGDFATHPLFEHEFADPADGKLT